MLFPRSHKVSVGVFCPLAVGCMPPRRANRQKLDPAYEPPKEVAAAAASRRKSQVHTRGQKQAQPAKKRQRTQKSEHPGRFQKGGKNKYTMQREVKLAHDTAAERASPRASEPASVLVSGPVMPVKPVDPPRDESIKILSFYNARKYGSPAFEPNIDSYYSKTRTYYSKTERALRGPEHLRRPRAPREAQAHRDLPCQISSRWDCSFGVELR